MRIFVIGATGYIGSHVAQRLKQAGHLVLGSARDERGLAKLAGLGIESWQGGADDLVALTQVAGTCDATIFAAQLPSQEQERDTISALLDAYQETGKTLVFTSGTGVLSQRTEGDWSDETFAEDDEFVTSKYITVRRETERLVRAAAQRGVRAMVMRPPMIWGAGYHGAVDRILHSIDKTGQACYVGPGLNLYTTVHVEDLADAYLLAIDKGVSGALYHAAGEELNYRSIAELVAIQQDVTTRSVTSAEAVDIWDKFTMLVLLAACSRSRSPRARQELGWKPVRRNVIGEILAGELNSRQRS